MNRRFALLFLVCAILSTNSFAQAALVTIGFGQGVVPGNGGTSNLADQTFEATGDLSGNIGANGSGFVKPGADTLPFKFTPPLNHPPSLKGGLPVYIPNPADNPSYPELVHPISSPYPSPATVFDITPGQLNSISNLDLDLLNGATANFALETITFTTNSSVGYLNAIPVEGSFTLSDISFTQTGASTVVGGPGSGTFSVAGDLSASLTNFLATVYTIVPAPLPDVYSITAPFWMTGTWTVSGPTNDTKIELDGNLDFGVPLADAAGLSTILGFPFNLTISSTVAMAVTLAVSVGYHLEQSHIVIPEPGSVVLLLLGCCAFLPIVYWNRDQYWKKRE